MKVIALIPAKGDSGRLKNKNKRELLGKPLIQWTIDAALKSKYIEETYVFSEDLEIVNLAKKNREEGKNVREIQLSNESLKFEKKDVIRVYVANLVKNKKITDEDTVFCILQANSPQVEPHKIDEAIEKVMNNEKVYQCNSMNKDTLITDGAIRVFKMKCLDDRGLNMYLSTVLTDYIDIHTEEDLKEVENILKRKVDV